MNTMMIQTVIAVSVSVLISVKVTSIVLLKVYEETLDDYEKYNKQIVLNGIIIRSILEGKDKIRLLELYDETMHEVEEGAGDAEE